MAYDYSQAGYSPEILDYVTGLDARRNELIGKYAGQNVGLDNPDFLTPQQVQQPASDEYKTEYLPEEVIREYMSRNPVNSENDLNAGVDLISYGGSRDPAVYDMARLGYAKGPYTYTDKATGQTYTASTPEQKQAMAKMAMRQSTTGTAPMKDSNYGGGNNTANYEIRDASGKRVAYDLPYTAPLVSQVGQTIADIGRDYALPALGMMMGPGGALITGFIGGTMKDESTEDLAINAGLNVAKAYAANYASPYINSALTDAGYGGDTLDQLFPKTPSGFWGPYATVDPSFAGPSGLVAPSFAGPSSVSYSGGNLVPPSFAGPSLSYSNAVPSVSSGVAGSVYGGPIGGNIDTVMSGMTRAAVTQATPGVLPGLAALIPGSTYGGPVSAPPGVEAVESGVVRTPTASTTPDTPGVLPALAALTPAEQWLTSQAAKNAAEPIVGEQPKEKSPLEKYATYASLGLKGAGLLAAAFGSGTGGKASGAGGSGTFTPDKLPDIFSAKLPGVGTGAGGGTGFNTSTAPYGATDPGAGGQNLTAEDYYKYGFGPEKSFFKNIPGRPIGMAKGGSPNRFAVRGPGTGRSDDIPANLSDGEYVIDAETVALLGDGSSKAGADKLDRFRVNVRKHKGKSLAAGRFSVAAKQPEAYLKGRK